MADSEQLTTEELRERSIKLLKDQSVNWSMLVLIGGLRLTALANMVLQRTLSEEQEPEQVYQYMLNSAREKAREEGTDLNDLKRVMLDFVPPFLEEEISRLRSAQDTQRLVADSKRKSQACTIEVQGQSGSFQQRLLLLLGTADKVANAIDELLGIPQAWVYEEDQQPVERSQIAYLNHRLSDDFGCRTVPLHDWGSVADNLRDWAQFLERVGAATSLRHLVVSNLNLAGKFPPPRSKPLVSSVKSSVSTISRWLANHDCTVVAGLYYPQQQHDPVYERELRDYVAKRANVTLWKLN